MSSMLSPSTQNAVTVEPNSHYQQLRTYKHVLVQPATCRLIVGIVGKREGTNKWKERGTNKGKESGTNRGKDQMKGRNKQREGKGMCALHHIDASGFF